MASSSYIITVSGIPKTVTVSTTSVEGEYAVALDGSVFDCTIENYNPDPEPEYENSSYTETESEDPGEESGEESEEEPISGE